MRFWTVDEARAYLPRLKELVEIIRTAALVRAGRHPPPKGQRSLVVDAEEAHQEIQAGDVILRDATTGLLDFHAQGTDGVYYCPCWRRGEPDPAWWHLPEDGLPGRKPLPREATA